MGIILFTQLSYFFGSTARYSGLFYSIDYSSAILNMGIFLAVLAAHPLVLWSSRVRRGFFVGLGASLGSATVFVILFPSHDFVPALLIWALSFLVLNVLLARMLSNSQSLSSTSSDRKL